MRVSGVVSDASALVVAGFCVAYFTASHVAASVDTAMSDSPTGAAAGMSSGATGDRVDISSVLTTNAAHFVAADAATAVTCHFLRECGPIGAAVLIRVEAAMHHKNAGDTSHQQLAAVAAMSRKRMPPAIFAHAFWAGVVLLLQHTHVSLTDARTSADPATISGNVFTAARLIVCFSAMWIALIYSGMTFVVDWYMQAPGAGLYPAAC